MFDVSYIEVVGETNVGMKRNHNEDNFAIVNEEQLYVVADGMGGHASGEVASKLAVDTIHDFFKATGQDPDRTWPYRMERGHGYQENRLVTSIKLANLKIYQEAKSTASKRGMGTTVVAAFVTYEGVYLSHVGDSRIYRIRDNRIEQLTEDHSLLNDYIKMKRLTPEEIAKFPHKNVIVRALGMKEHVKVDVRFEATRTGDIFLLCSDGLSGVIEESDMLNIVRSSADLNSGVRRLIARANENGGPDNITAILLKWVA